MIRVLARLKYGARKLWLNTRSYWLNEVKKRLVPEAHHVDELLEGFERLANVRVAENEWQGFVQELAEAFRSGNPGAFLRYPFVRRVMNPRQIGLTSRYLDHLRGQAIWRDVLSKACVESRFGDPIIDPSLPQASPLLIQHCFHLSKVLETTGIPLDRLSTFFEFGGAWGSFALLLKNLRFEGSHVIYDLPHMTLLQQFYLKNAFRERLDTDPDFLGNISYLSGDPTNETVARAVRSVAEDRPSVFLATWSLSETPIDLRNSFLPLISRFDFVCIAYQSSFGSVDNHAYFQSVLPEIDSHDWEVTRNPAAPWTRYARGVRRKQLG
jgi:hypothetical protein